MMISSRSYYGKSKSLTLRPSILRAALLGCVVFVSSSGYGSTPFPSSVDGFNPSIRQEIKRHSLAQEWVLTPHTAVFTVNEYARLSEKAKVNKPTKASVRDYFLQEDLLEVLKRLPLCTNELDLSYNHLHDLSPFIQVLGRFPKLEILSLRGNLLRTFSSVIPLPKALPSLRQLDLSFNLLTEKDLEAFVTGGPLLQRISLGGNHLTAEQEQNIARRSVFELAEPQRYLPQGLVLPVIPAAINPSPDALACWEVYRNNPTAQRWQEVLQSAVALGHPGAKYKLALLYQQDQDPVIQSRSATLLIEAAQEGWLEAQAELGLHYRAGYRKLIAKNREESMRWLTLAAVRGSQESQYVLGGLYEETGVLLYDRDGFVIEETPPRHNAYAVYWYEQAANQDVYLRVTRSSSAEYSSQRHLGRLYDEGRGILKSPVKALYFSLAAAHQNKVSAQYQSARLHRILRRGWQDEVESLWWVLRGAQPENTHYASQFLLGTFYEQGIALKKDLGKANALYTQSSPHHWPASFKKTLIDRAVSGKGLKAEYNLEALNKTIQSHYVQAQERLTVGLGDNLRIDGYSLNDDYEQATTKAREMVANQYPLQVNVDFIGADPFLKYYNRDLDQEISDQQSSLPAFTAFFQGLVDSVRDHPAFVSPVLPALNNIFRRLIVEGRESNLSRKKLLRLYQDQYQRDRARARDEEKKGRESFDSEFAMMIYQNADRCRDGLDVFLQEEENKLGGIASGKIPLGARLSQVLNQHKEEVLKLHRNPLPGAHEEATEASRLLRERMRLPLGLKGVFQNPLYPGLGRGDDEKYKPAQVMERFLRGGSLHFTRSEAHVVVPIPAYTPELMIRLVRQAQQDRHNTVLQNPHIDEFIRRHSKFCPLFDQAISDVEPNEYFDPTIENGRDMYTDVFFEDLLVEHGYLIRRQQAS